MRTKAMVRTAHRLLAFVALLPLILLGATGALLVFPEPLERVVHGDRVADPHATIRPASELVASAHSKLPEGDRIVRMQYPKSPGDTLSAQSKEGRIVVLDPSNAQVLRVVEEDGFDVHRFLVRLHVDLFAGKVGAWITGLSALALVILCLTGLHLWWPRGRWAWHYFKVKFASGRVRANYDLHRATGLYASWALFLIAGTGVMMAFFSQSSAAVHWITGSPVRPPEPRKVNVLPIKPLSADQVVAIAKAHVPDTDLYRLYPPRAKDAPYRVFLVPDHDRLIRAEETRLVIDPFTGTILSEDGPRTSNAADGVLRWLLPIHFGTFGGTPMRVVYVAMSLSPLLLSVTGLLIWRKRHRARHVRKLQPEAALAGAAGESP